MIFALVFYTVLTLLSWAALWPMLREPRLRSAIPAVTYSAVPVVTFDPRGLV